MAEETVVHEYSIAVDVVQTALRHAGGRRVVVVSMRLGALRQVMPGTLASALELAARGTLCEGARLDQKLIECRLRCSSCAIDWTASEPAFRCATCGGAAEVLSGNELQVESIEVEEEVGVHVP
ncbi:MAG: hydrogenase maturation nickel metallochaperone HypA [Solirubrobacteraceae bacterium]